MQVLLIATRKQYFLFLLNVLAFKNVAFKIHNQNKCIIILKLKKTSASWLNF